MIDASFHKVRVTDTWMVVLKKEEALGRSSFFATHAAFYHDWMICFGALSAGLILFLSICMQQGKHQVPKHVPDSRHGDVGELRHAFIQYKETETFDLVISLIEGSFRMREWKTGSLNQIRHDFKVLRIQILKRDTNIIRTSE